MERLTVVHVAASLDVGGLERVVFDLATRTDASRFATRVICLEAPGAWAPRFAQAGVPVDCVGRAGEAAPLRITRLARYLRRVGADVVHLHNVKAHLAGALAAGLARVPAILSTKHGRSSPGTRLSKLANRLACHLCSDLVGVSEDCAALWRTAEGAPAHKVSVVTNGVDLQAFTAAHPPRSGAAVAVSVARLSEVKDPLTLLHAVRLMCEQAPGFRLDLAGDGPLRSDVEAAIRQLGLSDTVRVLGTVDDVRSVLRRADFFVLASRSEGLSLTLLEAMAEGLPIVATRVGGNAEVVVSGDTGLLVPAGDTRAMADAILWMSRNPEARLTMGRRGRRRVEERFDLERTVDTYQRMYRRAFEARRQPSASVTRQAAA